MERTGSVDAKALKAAWQEGYEAAISKMRLALKLRDMGMADCEIVKRTDLPPFIVHGMMGERKAGR